MGEDIVTRILLEQSGAMTLNPPLKGRVPAVTPEELSHKLTDSALTAASRAENPRPGCDTGLQCEPWRIPRPILDRGHAAPRRLSY
ncbi:hypothetical protein J6590_046467 [Homalodisca vitripennis]|nr:hypothetical protein J6590_046467 [Homalodisca vitripennis]